MLTRSILAMALVAAFLALPSCRNRDANKKQHVEHNPGGKLREVLAGGDIFSQPHSNSKDESSAETLFEKIDAASIGISFLHQWKPRNTYEAQLLKTGFTGGGVCMGDFDDDGLCDVYLTRPHGGGRLFRNLGGFRFEDVTASAQLTRESDWCTGSTFVDVDNDGDLDLCVSNYDSSNRLFLNNGDGTFSEATSIGLGFQGASIKTIFSDYDNDGDLDAYVVTNRLEPKGPVKIRYIGSPGSYRVAPEHRELAMAIDLPNGEQKFAKAGQYDRLYKNQLAETGKLQFTNVTKQANLAGNFHGLDATWWDYNHDGHPDIYVANDFTDPDQWLRNNGDGTFTDITKEIVPNTPWFAMGSAFGDLNNDGLLDLIATDMSGTTHYREKMAMGSMDSVSWFLDTAEPRQYMRNAVYINTGTDRFLELAHLSGLASSDWTWSVKVADLDNDGFEDVFTTNGFTRDYLNSDFNEQLRKKGKAADSMAWHAAPELKEKNIAFRNCGNLEFKSGANWGLDELSICFGAAYGDLDGDGDLDLITSNFAGPPSVFRNRSSQNRLTISLHGTGSNAMGLGAFVTATVDGATKVRYSNHANGYLSSNQPIVHLGLGSAKSVAKLEVTWPSGAMQSFSNIDANQHLRIREPESVATQERPDATPIFEQIELTHVRHQERYYDDFARQPLLPNRLSQNGPGLAAADVNNDGRSDLFLGGAAGSPGKLYLLSTAGSFEDSRVETFDQHLASEDMGSLLIDVDNDGDRDLYVVSGGVEVANADDETLRDRLYLNRFAESGKLSFQHAPESLPDIRSSGSIATACDFDRDGDLDIFVGGRLVPHAYPTVPASQLLRNDSGKFTDCVAETSNGLAKVGMVTSAVWSDIDNDGWSDLLVALEYGAIRVFKNDSGQLRDVTSTAGTEALTGWWNSIVASDVDCDGDMDFVVGNLGLNTKYHPSVKKPQYMFYGDFDESGTNRIVEAKPSSDGLLPVRGRSCSSNAMPHLRKKFDSFHKFATSSLSDIYSDKCLDESLRLQATTTSSGVLLNDGKGHFKFSPFPKLAQTAPVFGIQITHVNQDPYPDLILAQNFYGPQRETGRMNGGVGCLLVGSATGQFETVRSDKSGIVIPADAKGVVSVDINADGRFEAIVGVNHGPAILIRNQSNVTPLRLRLSGDPTSIDGSRLRISFQDSSTSVLQVSSGDGYLSHAVNHVIEVGYRSDNPPTSVSVVTGRGRVSEVSLDDLSNTVDVSLRE